MDDRFWIKFALCSRIVHERLRKVKEDQRFLEILYDILPMMGIHKVCTVSELFDTFVELTDFPSHVIVYIIQEVQKIYNSLSNDNLKQMLEEYIDGLSTQVLLMR